jgi:hypothetical protein
MDGINHSARYFQRLVLVYIRNIPSGIIVKAGILVNIAKPINNPDTIIDTFFSCFAAEFEYSKSKIDVSINGN